MVDVGQINRAWCQAGANQLKSDFAAGYPVRAVVREGVCVQTCFDRKDLGGGRRRACRVGRDALSTLRVAQSCRLRPESAVGGGWMWVRCHLTHLFLSSFRNEFIDKSTNTLEPSP